jgi:hypothetical protein
MILKVIMFVKKLMNLIKRTCLCCNKEFEIKKSLYMSDLSKSDRKRSGIYCSIKCVGIANKKRKQIHCKQCNTIFQQKSIKQKFCNKSCATIYNNQHKKTGTRVSKLEKYLSLCLRI